MKSSNPGPSLAHWPRLARAWDRGRLAQSLLVIGQTESVTAVGQALARQWLCEYSSSGECACRSCGTELERHPDLTVLEPDPRTIRRESVGRALERIQMHPLWSPASVIWFQQAEKLTPESENYLLKSLEEPMPYVRFLLTTTSPDRLLPTIRSRCQWFRVGGLGNDRPATTDFAVAKLWDREQSLPEAVLSASDYTKMRYLENGRGEWLDLWETLWRIYSELEQNGNADIAREILREAWGRILR